MGSKKMMIGLGLAVVVAGGCWLWFGQGADQAASENKGPVLPAVKAGQEVVAEGTVVPVLKAGLSLPVPGIVAQIAVAEGARAAQGQVLLKLENQTLVAALHQAQAGLVRAQANLANTRSAARPQDLTIRKAAVNQAWSAYQTALTEKNRTQLLFNQQGASQQQLDQALAAYQSAQSAWQQAQAELDLTKAGARSEAIAAAQAEVAVAKAAVEQAASALAQTELKAPFAGTIASVDVKPGEYISPGTPALQLADLTRWEIKSSDLTELNVVRIKPGNAVSVTFDGIPNLTLPGKVNVIRSYG
ncbi:MAG TPA: HlyD family efflux transporter periplasmic adaptor subunit [Bacillota bacterium]|nr:HlyD family efflux transporter periplasmic adaptor subunit [Bacillota bacterium]